MWLIDVFMKMTDHLYKFLSHICLFLTKTACLSHISHLWAFPNFQEFSVIFGWFYEFPRLLYLYPPKLTFHRWAPTRFWSVPMRQPHLRNELWQAARPIWSSNVQVMSLRSFTAESGTHKFDFSQTTSKPTFDCTMLISAKKRSIFIYYLQLSSTKWERYGSNAKTNILLLF